LIFDLKEEEKVMSTKLTIAIPRWLDRIFACPLLTWRLLRYGFAFRRIYLGENTFTIVDPRDFYWLNNFQWYDQQKDQNTYVVRFILNPGKRVKIVSMHREIMKPPENLLVDHRNCDGLDNRRQNLRLATPSQNMCNRRKTTSKTSSRFVGVCFDKGTGRWLAYIVTEGKTKWLGRFDNEIDAAKARDIAAIKYHKEFARLNFSEEAPAS
jgi:hypothetical protein